jgi:hypothetical protein
MGVGGGRRAEGDAGERRGQNTYYGTYYGTYSPFGVQELAWKSWRAESNNVDLVIVESFEALFSFRERARTHVLSARARELRRFCGAGDPRLERL